MMLAPEVAAQAACTGQLAIVDAAFNGRGAASAPCNQKMKALCAVCPIWDACLRDALETGEHGPWGGTVERERNKATGSRPYRFNMVGIDYPTPTNDRRGSPPNTRRIKDWALEQGLIDHVGSGSVRRDIREAYEAAHPS